MPITTARWATSKGCGPSARVVARVAGRVGEIGSGTGRTYTGPTGARPGPSLGCRRLHIDRQRGFEGADLDDEVTDGDDVPAVRADGARRQVGHGTEEDGWRQPVL